MKFHVMTAALLFAPALALASPMTGGGGEIGVPAKREAPSFVELTLEQKKRLRVQVLEPTGPGRVVIAELPRATICDAPTKILRHQCVKEGAERGPGRVTRPVEARPDVQGSRQSANSRQVSLADQTVSAARTQNVQSAAPVITGREGVAGPVKPGSDKPVVRPGQKPVKPAFGPRAPQKPGSSRKG